MNGKSSQPTLAEELTHLLGDQWQSECLWERPPELFAVCAWLLEASGAYVRVLENWPPGGRELIDWVQEVETIAEAVRQFVIKKHADPQATFDDLFRLPELWRVVLDNAQTPIADINLTEELSGALIELVAIADLACVCFGIPPIEGHEKSDLGFYEWVQWNLTKDGTLTPRFPTTRLTVLPKQHTPQSGITLRSLTHNLALFTGGEVQPAWSVHYLDRGDQLNLLVVPWPYEVMPRQFSPVNKSKAKYAEEFRCFDFEVRSAVASGGKMSPSRKKFERWLIDVFDTAEHKVGPIHGVVFPEAALTQSDFRIVNAIARDRGAFLIAGVGGPPMGHVENSHPSDADELPTKRGINQVWMSFGPDKDRGERIILQGKHHRWQLNRSQLEMYGLAGNLDPKVRWWENMVVGRRDVNFVSLHAHMAICALICEDLARQDPVSNLVRAVGPNLVIALLSDGPQLQTRWPSRYATVLADDPGSSVLTVTNLGMTQLAEPPPGKQRSRSVALWKDAVGGQREIELADGASAVVLNLWTSCAEEWTADGRSDSGVAAFPTLGGVHQVKVADVPRL